MREHKPLNKYKWLEIQKPTNYKHYVKRVGFAVIETAILQAFVVNAVEQR
jgi:hypothetical protein